MEHANRPLPSLNALRAFNAAARLLSMSHAAEALSVTHGAISRQIGQLEQQLGIALFERQGRGIALTTAGHQLFATTDSVFSQLEQVCERLRREARDAPLVLSCSGSFLARWFIPRLGRLRQDCPGLDIHLTTTDEELHLPAGVDAALGFTSASAPTGQNLIVLGPERIGPVMAPGLAPANPDMPASALLELPLLETLSRPQAWPQWCKHQQLDTQSLPIRQSFEHLNYMLEAALVGLGVAIAPHYLVEEDLRSGRLLAPWGFIETRDTLCLRLPGDTVSPRAQRLADWLAKALAR
jgi:DNA-binding transcriptional LysR family regulator